MRLSFSVLWMLIPGLFFLPASADLIDQDQPSAPEYMAAFDQTDLAQSFQQTHSDISGAGILLQSGEGTSDTVTISLWDALPNEGGTQLATASATGTQGEWVDVFWDSVGIVPGITYYLVFSGNSTLGIAGDTHNPYPFGNVYANDDFFPFPNYDFAFRSYYDPAPVKSESWSRIKAIY